MSDKMKVSEAAALGDQVADKDKRKRIDLRDKPLVTIDGEDPRDFDDANLPTLANHN